MRASGRADEAPQSTRSESDATGAPLARDMSRIATLESQATALFVGPLAQWAGSLAFRDHPDAIATDRLADRLLFDDLLARFGRTYPGADRHALASFWSQHYFSRLTIALTMFCLSTSRPLALDLRDIGVRFCPAQGTPLCFHLREGGPPRSGDALVKALYEEQVAATVAHLKRHCGLSARLLWENAGSYGLWSLGEIARTRPDRAAVARTLLTDTQWPRAACAMLPHLKRAEIERQPALRRVCCLRYRLPGVARCAGTCPHKPNADEGLARDS